MLTDPKLRSQVDALWDKFWTGGLSNPLDAIEQFSYSSHRPEGFVLATRLFCASLQDESSTREQATFGTFLP
jgi:hypothetical protein